MKTTFVLMVIILIGIHPGFAQKKINDSIPAEKRITSRVNKMKADLNLSDDQASKLSSVYLKQFQDNQVLRKKMTEIKKQMKENNQKVRL